MATAGVPAPAAAGADLRLTRIAPPPVIVIFGATGDLTQRKLVPGLYSLATQQLLPPETAIIGVDDARSAAIRDDMAKRDSWKVIAISATQRLERGVFVQNGALYDAIDDIAWCVCDLTGIATLPGAHNWQNAAARLVAQNLREKTTAN